ncbi:sacsin N-terminal ATP-binding-like domain-containing protein [Epilithonimonas sp. UC225_85]|uniref:sacsin N-terminal ATP-binding-like domain-containing protein n=1 Tax=Epilithonimonas sp. UC225_85 TaxID=3350167 RepID=UPI0036D43FA0
METQVSRADLYKYKTQRNDLKQHADKIIQGIKKIGPNHAKRAIWELFQNAVDLSPSCEIELKLSDNELIFSHNGVPFTMHTLDCLFTQVSSKTLTEKKIEREEADPIGQYGTGFMTSHSFGDIVKVSGAIQDELYGEYSNNSALGNIKFTDLVIDRSTQDWEKLCDEISDLRKTVTELLNKQPTFDELPKTVFKFGFNNELNKKRAFDATESLKVILPYVMIFNDRLKKVTVIDNQGNITTYIKNEIEEFREYCYTREIQINDEIKRINYLKTDRLTIVLPLDDNLTSDKYIGNAQMLPESLPRLFLYYPLIGTEHFGFNFVIHSKNFQPTEPRDGLHLNSENEKNKTEELANQKLLQEASDLIFSFLENNLSKIQNPHLLAEINFPVSSDDAELNKYFIEFKEKWTNKFKTLPFVETQNARISVQEAVFLNSSVILQTDENTLGAIYKIVADFYGNLPKSELIPIYTKLMDNWNIWDIQRIGFADIVDKIQEDGAIESFNKSELILLYKELIRKEQVELFDKAIIPNIKGQFKRRIDLSRSVDLTAELLSLADVLNPKITNRQIDIDFLLEGLEFENFGRRNYMELINASLDEHIKENTRSESLPENYLARLIQYASIIPKEDSISGPVKVIKLIEQHYDLELNSIVLSSISGEDNIDIRKGQNDLFKVFLNDISNKDTEWTKENLEGLAIILKEAFNYADVKKIFLRYDVYPNQLNELKGIINLYSDNKIPEFVKDLYDNIVEPSSLIRTTLAHSVIENIYDEMKSTKALDLTSEIEIRFFGQSGNEIHMENHPYRSYIIDIIRNFKPDKGKNELYEELFPATSRNKSAILVQLADGEASFTILSQHETVIRKLAGIAGHPNLEELIKLGEDALLRKQQDEIEMQYKKKLGNHLEDVLLKRLTQNINAKVISEQDGQDIVVYIDEKPIYYIEVKSKWIETTPIRISRNQTLRAHQNPNCFALCSIDMTKYAGIDKYEIEKIENVVEFMKFNTDLGIKVGHLVDIYENAHQIDKFSLDGDYRTLIPAGYINGGLALGPFENELLRYIEANYSMPN